MVLNSDTLRLLSVLLMLFTVLRMRASRRTNPPLFSLTWAGVRWAIAVLVATFGFVIIVLRLSSVFPKSFFGLPITEATIELFVGFLATTISTSIALVIVPNVRKRLRAQILLPFIPAATILIQSTLEFLKHRMDWADLTIFVGTILGAGLVSTSVRSLRLNTL